ncbi:CLUMA_CG003509, isoform A [Clunio marinus]|uniref:CLUMA_CG003509, isoform A n=1 Tax=Clunio marinus TaxID=568069 RepID=A0A1J1HQQ3_9DIPT|nr:CLUMA_CG003509, isoform A [Clunio marinus]
MSITNKPFMTIEFKVKAEKRENYDIFTSTTCFIIDILGMGNAIAARCGNNRTLMFGIVELWRQKQKNNKKKLLHYMIEHAKAKAQS